MNNFVEQIDSLKAYQTVYVSGHLNPDSDSVASTVAMTSFLKSQGINAKAIYGGYPIDKLNLKLMMHELKLTIENVNRDFKVKDNEFLLLVDCQQNQSNTDTFGANHIGCIDHHTFADNFEEQTYVFHQISPGIGSCATLVYEMISQNYPSFSLPENIKRAMLMGLLVDTNNLTNGVSSADIEFHSVVNTSEANKQISGIMRAAYTEGDVRILADVITRRIRVGGGVVSFVGDCDNNLLGQISDFMCEIENTDYVILVSEKEDVFRFSIRSYGNISANVIAEKYVHGIGSGGGHHNKSAGVIYKDKLAKLQLKTIESYTIEFMRSITLDSKILIYGKDSVEDFLEHSTVYKAKKQYYSVRYIKLSDLIGQTEGVCSISTLEGIVDTDLNNYLIIGVKGEPYPVDGEMFERTYTVNGSLPENEVLIHGDQYVDPIGIKVVFNGVSHSISKDTILSFKTATTKDTKEVIVTHTDYPIVVHGKHGMLSSAKGSYLVIDKTGEFYLCEEKVFYITYEILSQINEEEIKSFLGSDIYA